MKLTKTGKKITNVLCSTAWYYLFHCTKNMEFKLTYMKLTKTTYEGARPQATDRSCCSSWASWRGRRQCTPPTKPRSGHGIWPRPLEKEEERRGSWGHRRRALSCSGSRPSYAWRWHLWWWRTRSTKLLDDAMWDDHLIDWCRGHAAPALIMKEIIV